MLDKIKAHSDTLQDSLDSYTGLTERYRGQRDAYKEQRDAYQDVAASSTELITDYKEQRDRFSQELDLLEPLYNELVGKAHQLELDSASSYQPWEVGLIAGGSSIGAILIGLGIGALIK